MTKLLALLRPLLFLLLLSSLTGCFQMNRGSLEDEKDPHVIEGKQRAAAYDYDGAIESFEKALQTNPNNAAANLEVALLYETRKSNYVSAIYHYERHLKLRPDSPMADVVKQKITGCIRELAKDAVVVFGTRDIQIAIERLTSTNNLLKKQIESLQAELDRRPIYVTNYVTNFATTQSYDDDPPSSRPTARNNITANSQAQSAPAAARTTRNTAATRPSTTRQNTPSATAGNTTASGDWSPSFQTRPASRSSTSTATPAARPTRGSYTVRVGDTFASIARRNGISLAALKAANPGVNPNKVRAGQTLSIPAR